MDTSRLRKVVIAGVVIVLALALAAGGAYLYYGYAPGPDDSGLRGDYTEHSVEIAGDERTYRLYTPPGLDDAAPLVLALHGSTQNGDRMRDHTGLRLDELADEHGFAVAYPDGIRGAWNECRVEASTRASRDDVPDVEFLTAVVSDVDAAHGVTDTFAFGYSNGGQMAYRLALETELLTAAATVGSNLPVADNFDCDMGSADVPMMFVYGSEDPIVPFEGGEASLFGLSSRGEVSSAAESFDRWAEAVGLDPADAHVEELPVTAGDGTRVRSTSLGGPGGEGAAAPHLLQYDVYGAGHVIPQRTYRPPRALGPTTGNLDAPEAAVEFFLRR